MNGILPENRPADTLSPDTHSADILSTDTHSADTAAVEIGIFGGTFDPLHVGHLAVAEAALRQCGLGEVWLMVSPENPFKSGRRITPEGERIEMCRAALESLPAELRGRIHVSDFETRLPRPSYTIDTLHALDEAYPGCRFRIIIGGDNLDAFDRWRSPEEILTRYGVIVYPRPGQTTADMSKIPSGCVILKDVRLMDVSSTELRGLLRDGDTAGLAGRIPEAEIKYIKEHHIYDRD